MKINIENESQIIDFTSIRIINRAFYSKIAYGRNAMAILIINKHLSDISIFDDFSSNDIAAATFLYMLMSDSKKRENNKAAEEILNPKRSNFIDQNVFYFKTWLDRFRHDFFQSQRDRDLLPKILMIKMTKKKVLSKTKNIEKSNKEFDTNIPEKKSREPRSIIQSKRSKNDDLIYKTFSMQSIFMWQSPQEQPKIDNLKRKFENLFRLIEEHFRKKFIDNDRNQDKQRTRNESGNKNRNRDRRNRNHFENSIDFKFVFLKKKRFHIIIKKFSPGPKKKLN